MAQSHQDWLGEMAAIVARQHELVPFLQDLHPPQDMAFRPLPAEMLKVLRSSPDFSEPEAGVPTLLMLETDELSGGLVVVRCMGDDGLYVLAPRT